MRLASLRTIGLLTIGSLIIGSVPSLIDAQFLTSQTLVSGNGTVGSTDPNNEMSLDNGLTWNPAVIVTQGQNGYPASIPYDTIPGTNYISTAADGSTPQFSTARYRTFFTLPPNAQFASILVNVHVDNLVTILLNGTVIGTEPLNTCCPAAYFQNPPESFGSANPALFLPGQNTLEFYVYNHSNRSALDYEAQISYATVNPPGINPCPNADIKGTPGNDAIIVSTGPHVIDGMGGNDAIVSIGTFNDIICGGTGDDAIDAGGGNDIVFGGPGNDLISGNSGMDVLLGEQGNDQINGGAGVDACFDVQGTNTFSQCP